MKKIAVLFFVSILASMIFKHDYNCEARTIVKFTKLPKESGQLLLVVGESWDSLKATMYLCERDGEKWKRTGKAIPAVIGKKGLGWGIGLHDTGIQYLHKATVKREGDGKSPAGIFDIGKCMGYAQKLPFTANIAYEQIKSTYHGVDDPDSKYYNRIVDTRILEKPYRHYWKSHEMMKRRDDLYKWLFTIKHNDNNIPGKGSLIFLHVWRNRNKGTAGCTAVSERNILKVAKWIDKKKRPLFVLLPKSVYNAIGNIYGFPKLR